MLIIYKVVFFVMPDRILMFLKTRDLIGANDTQPRPSDRDKWELPLPKSSPGDDLADTKFAFRFWKETIRLIPWTYPTTPAGVIRSCGSVRCTLLWCRTYQLRYEQRKMEVGERQVSLEVDHQG